MPEIHTERLILREAERLDAVDLSMLLTNSCSQESAAHLYSPDDILNLIDEEKAFAVKSLSMVIENKADEAVIGIISVNEYHKKAVDIAYFLKPELRRQGYMTEALSAYCAYLFQSCEIDVIIAEYRCENEASAALLQKCGFQKAGSAQTLLNDYRYHEVAKCILTKDKV